MATTVDTLLVEVTADLKDVRRKLAQLEKDTKQTGEKSAQNLNKFSKVVRAVVGAVVVREFARASISAVNFASHIEEMQAKSGVVFGQFANEVRADLKAFGDEVGRSRFELEEMAASVQDTFVPMGFARGAAADLSVQLAKLATDVASFNNASDVETMRAFQSALVGNHETVRRFGIVITEAELQAELFRMGITKSKDQITAAEKVQARLNLILAGTTDAQGDAARTADSYANQVKAMQASVDELRVAVGERMMPVFLDFVKTINEASTAITAFLDRGKPDLSTIEGVTAAQVDLRKEIQENIREQAKLTAANGEGTAGMRLLQAEYARMIAEYSNLEAAIARIILKRREEAEANARAAQGGAAPPTDAALGKGTKTLLEQTNALEILKAQIKGATEAEIALLEAQQDGAAFTPEQLEKYAAQAEAIRQLQLQLEALNQINDLVQSSLLSFSQSVAQEFTNMVTGVSKGMEGLKNTVSSIINTIIAKLIELTITNRIVNAAMGLAVGPEKAAQFALPTLATGGAMQPNTPTLVGERGPELVIPKSASVVRNAADTRGMVGGSSIVINQSLNFSTGVSQTVRSEVLALMPQITQASKAAVLDARQRGGSFAKAF